MLNLHSRLSAETAGEAITPAKAAARFLLPPPDTPQETIQTELEALRGSSGLPAAMDALYRWELSAGYISKEKLESSECLRFYNAEYEIDIYVQVNRARSGYTPVPPPAEELPPVHCAICRENVGRPGKEHLRVFEFAIEGAAGTSPDFFLQLTPYPVFPYHFVVITLRPEPMRVDRRSLKEMVRFSELAPGYTVCSNSDVRGAGSSILEHHHLQVCKGLTLPVMTAGPLKQVQGQGCRVDILHYPLAAVRIEGTDPAAVTDTAASMLEKWKERDPGRNTANIIFSRECGRPCFYLLFRNPGYQTPEHLLRIKQEGIGIIEAAGAGIFPVPSGPAEADIWEEIRNRGKEVMLGILSGINPIRQNRTDALEELIPWT